MLDDLIAERRKKLEKLRKEDVNPYPHSGNRTHSVFDARRSFESLSRTGAKVSLSGRLRGIRDQGNIVFMDLRDESGSFQIVLKKDSAEKFEFWKSILDIGDFVSVSGPLFKTKKEEESLDAQTIQILSKSIRPLPSEWYGLENMEARLRERYLDLLMNEDARDIFRKKAVFWETFRNYLNKNGFLEVDTPVFEEVPGGADAEPFKTHHNALDVDFYLRISLELPLKKLLVGGFEKIFEMGRIFRNEGMDKEHLQDYTQLEFYWAYHDYNDLMDFVETMYKEVIKKTMGSLMTVCGGEEIDWDKKWPRVEYVAEFKKAVGIDPLEAASGDLFAKAKSLGLEPEKNLGKGKLIDLIFKKTVRPALIQPVFLINPPIELVPLTKRSRSDPRLGERMQPVACGTELGNGFTELNDPVDQRARFKEQMRLRAEGDKEAQRLDEDFLTALQYGMPPAAGFGLSERFFSVLMDKPIRETVIFPLVKPKNKEDKT